jgi:hypothetical protein
VNGANIVSGTNPTATVTPTGGGGSASVSGTGSGQVGVAAYGSNPAGPVNFSSSNSYIDVIAAQAQGMVNSLTSATIKDCNLNGGSTINWWNGKAWVLASPQSYDATTKCVTLTVNNSTSVPLLGQLHGTPFAAGSPPAIDATAKTADGKPYSGGTWTNQTVTVTFTCSATATATPPTVTRPNEGKDQYAESTCTDGAGAKSTKRFSNIDVDKTPPTCAVTVSPTTLWPPNGKPVAITGTVTAGDTLSGLASVVGSAVTSNETLASGEVQGFTVNKTYSVPLQPSDSVSITGQLAATRDGNGSGRTYTQTITVKDQAGNTNAKPCTWTVSVPHDQGGDQGGPSGEPNH